MVKKVIKGPTRNYKAREQWRKAYEGIIQMRKEFEVPVAGEGCSNLADFTESPEVVRFQTLVSLMLSAQTKDTMTGKVMRKLRSNGLTLQRIIETETKSLSQEIYGVSFHNNKAKYIKKVAEILKEKYNSDVPRDYKALLKLPGVGPKMALLFMKSCYGEIHGIAVDTHVHRISNWLGWVETKTPEQTRKELESFLPEEVWPGVNRNLVGFGHTICKPVNPQCGKCKIVHLCPTGSKKLKLNNASQTKPPLNQEETQPKLKRKKEEDKKPRKKHAKNQEEA